jgi:hypothetical protein
MRIVLEIAVIVVIALMAHTAAGFPELARVFPLTVTILALAFALVSLIVDLAGIARRRLRDRPHAAAAVTPAAEEAAGNAEVEPGADAAEAEGAETAGNADAEFRRALYYVGWLVALLVLMRILGALAAAVVFLVAFLRLEAKWRWMTVLAGAGISFVILYALHALVNLQLPSGWINLVG